MQEVTKAETARQNRALHRMQLIMTTYNLKNITNLTDMKRFPILALLRQGEGLRRQ